VNLPGYRGIKPRLRLSKRIDAPSEVKHRSKAVHMYIEIPGTSKHELDLMLAMFRLY
jgi:hypothetical protein